MNQIVGERPSHEVPPSLGTTQPHSEERSTPRTMSARPMAQSAAPMRSRCGRSLDRRVLDAAREDEKDDDDDDLADEHVAPGGVGGDEAADERPDGDRHRGRRGDEAVGLRPGLDREVAGHQRDDRRHDQRGADALEERPADDEDREARRERRGQRAGGVDDAADGEGAAAADDAADLAAGDHQAGHHQRVQGDGRLDAGDRGAHVLGHGGDRDVHDRAVQRHDELAGRQHEEDEAGGCRGYRLGAVLARRRPPPVAPAVVFSAISSPSQDSRRPAQCHPTVRAAQCTGAQRGQAALPNSLRTSRSGIASQMAMSR